MHFSRSVFVAFAVSMLGLDAHIQAPAKGPIHDCFLKGFRVEHTETKFFVGEKHVKNSYYGTCNNGTLSCFKDDGQVDISDDQVGCKSFAFRRRLGVALPKKDRVSMRWPKGVLCYRPLNGLKSEYKETFLRAAAEYEAKTPVKIISIAECRARPDSDEICGGCQHAIQVVQQKDGCSSLIGYIKQANQEMNLADKCFDEYREVLHEFGHALGLFHEHTHRNREVIVLRLGTTVPATNYIRNDEAAYSTYDPDSIMHYTLGKSMCMPKKQYANTRFCDADEDVGKEGCILPEEKHCDRDHPLEKRAGFSIQLSAGDINSINYIYGDANPTPAPTPAPTPRPPAASPEEERSGEVAEAIGIHNLGVAASSGVLGGTHTVVTQEE